MKIETKYNMVKRCGLWRITALFVLLLQGIK